MREESSAVDGSEEQIREGIMEVSESYCHFFFLISSKAVPQTEMF